MFCNAMFLKVRKSDFFDEFLTFQFMVQWNSVKLLASMLTVEDGGYRGIQRARSQLSSFRFFWDLIGNFHDHYHFKWTTNLSLGFWQHLFFFTILLSWPHWGATAAEELSDRGQHPSHHAQESNIAISFPSLRLLSCYFCYVLDPRRSKQYLSSNLKPYGVIPQNYEAVASHVGPFRDGFCEIPNTCVR